jgi:TATA box binding protein associated factor (TAF)
MSLFRDVSHVKSISVQSGLLEVSEDACRLILWETELRLRELILESLKFMKQFRRDKLSDLDINCALENLHQPNKLVGLRQNYMNTYKQADECMVVLNFRLLETQ